MKLRTPMARRTRLALLAISTAWLSACGGGGGDQVATAPAPTSGSSPASSPTAIGPAPAPGPGAATPAAAPIPAASPAPAVAPTPAFSAFGPVVLGTNPTQYDSAIARLANGGNVVVWADPGATAYTNVVVAQRTDSQGNPVGDRITVQSDNIYSVTGFAVAAAPDGGFLVVSGHFSTPPGALYPSITNMLSRKYGADGVLQSESSLVSNVGPGLGQITVKPMPGGGFVVGWLNQAQQYAPHLGFMQRLDGAGAPVGSPVSVIDDPAAADQAQLSIVPLDGGRVTAVWQNMAIAPPQHFSIYSRVFDAALQPLTPPTELSGTAAPTTKLVSAAPVGSNVALAWTDAPFTDTTITINSSVLAPGSATPGAISTTAAARGLFRLQVESLGSGGFGVTWQELQVNSPPASSTGIIYLQRHDSTGAAESAPTQLLSRVTANGAGAYAGTGVAVEGGADGHVVGAAQIAGSSGTAEVIFGR